MRTTSLTIFGDGCKCVETLLPDGSQTISQKRKYYSVNRENAWKNEKVNLYSYSMPSLSFGVFKPISSWLRSNA
jgi:hypothetical protein